jgi:hypothetical protein
MARELAAREEPEGHGGEYHRRPTLRHCGTI